MNEGRGQADSVAAEYTWRQADPSWRHYVVHSAASAARTEAKSVKLRGETKLRYASTDVFETDEFFYARELA